MLNAYINVIRGMRNIKMISSYPVIGLLDQWTWDNSRSQISSSSVQPTKRFFFRPPFPCEESKLGTGLRIQNYLEPFVTHRHEKNVLPLSIPFLSLVILHLTRAPWNWRILLNEKLNAERNVTWGAGSKTKLSRFSIISVTIFSFSSTSFSSFCTERDH